MTIKTEHAGAKNGGGYWGKREEAKRKSSKVRRAQDRSAVAARSTICTRGTDPEGKDGRDTCRPRGPAAADLHRAPCGPPMETSPPRHPPPAQFQDRDGSRMKGSTHGE